MLLSTMTTTNDQNNLKSAFKEMRKFAHEWKCIDAISLSLTACRLTMVGAVIHTPTQLSTKIAHSWVEQTQALHNFQIASRALFEQLKTFFVDFFFVWCKLGRRDRLGRTAQIAREWSSKRNHVIRKRAGTGWGVILNERGEKLWGD